MKKLITLILSSAMLIIGMGALSGCSGIEPPPTATPKAASSADATPDPDLLSNTINAEIDFENGDVISLELYPDLAPITVANFVKLAKEGFYDGLVFHRVIENFMIQGGGYTADLEQKEADTIKGEFSANGVENNLKHERGVISMARTALSMDSASSQFFIMHETTSSLDGQYAAFGRVTDGMDVVDKIAALETTSVGGMDDVPVELPVISTIKILD